MPSGAAAPWRICAGYRTPTSACSSASASSSRTPLTSCARRSRWHSVTPSWAGGDSRIVVDELLRLRRLADRLLLLATSEDPDFLSRSPVDVDQLLTDALQRWTPIDRRWRLQPAEPAGVVGDLDRLGLALDALIENAVKH